MKYIRFASVLITLLYCLNVQGQYAEKHIQRLVGDIDQEWINSLGESIPSNQIEYAFREAQGFKKTSAEARKQASLNQSWFFYKNQMANEKSEPAEIQLPHHF